MKVYIIIEEGYDGGSIIGVRDTEEKAKALEIESEKEIKRLNICTSIRVEEWEVE